MRAGGGHGRRGGPAAGLALTTALHTVGLAEVATAQASLGAVPWAVTIKPAAEPYVPALLQVVHSGTGRRAADLKRANAAIEQPGPITCAFLSDLTIQGSSYLFHGDDIVVDGSGLAAVGVDWIRRPSPDSPLATPPATERWVDGLAVVATAPGHLSDRHWLLDFIPRFIIARDALGPEFSQARLILPHDTPPWALRMLELFAGTDPAQYEFYQRGVERLALRRVCVPGYGHTHYSFHPYAAAIYDNLGAQPTPGLPAKLCLSRPSFEPVTRGEHELLDNREAFEAAARRFGYTIVRPETLPLRDRAALFAGATHLVGEYGSGLHNAVFSPAGLRTGLIGCADHTQFRIAAMRRQRCAVVLPADERVGPDGVVRTTLSDPELEALLEANEA